jgi:hypothetical protein
VENLPGLSALAYRVGTHGRFKTSMLSALSANPALEALTTREDDDPAIALCDAWAVVLDVLSFYQERIVNEGYLRTATERRSILEMARSIGYELGPGVAAGTYLAFNLETAHGAPDEARIAIGTKAQSLPEQDELPQVYETVEEIKARGAWNALKPLTTRKVIPGFGAKEIYLESILTGLKPGDGLLMIGAEREADADSERWDFRRIKEIEPDQDGDYTKVTWDEGLGWQMFSRKVLPAQKDFQVYAMRQQAFLFGHNAPDWRTLPDEVRARYLNGTEADSIANTDPEWPHFSIADISETPDGSTIKTLYLNTLYPQIIKGSWLVLVTPEPGFYVEVYEVLEAVESSRKHFTLTAKTTAVALEGENLREKFNDSVRETVVFAQSEPLEVSMQPVTPPVQGHTIALDRKISDLNTGRRLIVSGKRARVEVPEAVNNLALKLQPGGQDVPLKPRDSLIVTKTPQRRPDGKLIWTLMDTFGRTGTVTAAEGRLHIVPAADSDATVNEVHVIQAVDPLQDPTLIELTQPLAHTLDRSTVTIFANVAKATHGETKQETLGNADGSRAFQQFELKQKPLTHVSAATPGGTQTTLTVRVNDLLWEEVPTLNGQPPEKRCYTSRLADDGTVTVQFGDGLTGARPPTGTANVSSTYRIGSGLAGQVKAGQISMLLTQVLGVKGVVNPLAAAGAADPEKLAEARRNAPLTILTFDRIVSLQDYEDFANAFAGIGKAQANMLWDGEQRLVHLTVAGADGRGVGSESELFQNLIDGIDGARHPEHRVIVDSFQPLNFDVKASVKIDAAYITEDVFQAITRALQSAFDFDSRSFGQAVTGSEVQACIQQVGGVAASFLEELYFTGENPELHARLPMNMNAWRVETNQAARLLTINPQGITLTKMTL